VERECGTQHFPDFVGFRPSALLNSSMNDDFLASRKGAKAQSFVAYFYQKF
jgi:hypothetical protein